MVCLVSLSALLDGKIWPSVPVFSMVALCLETLGSGSDYRLVCGLCLFWEVFVSAKDGGAWEWYFLETLAPQPKTSLELTFCQGGRETSQL